MGSPRNNLRREISKANERLLALQADLERMSQRYYYSESKGQVLISEMHQHHLRNAILKRGNLSQLQEILLDELVDRVDQNS